MNQNLNLSDLRKDYTLKKLEIDETDPDPVKQFSQWMQEALDWKLAEPTAMHLTTVSSDGKPHGRIVLLKEFDSQGFVFYTNYGSNKGKEMEENPNVAITFHWIELERQVRIEGKVEKISRERSEKYFHSRPRASQIAATASPQSLPVTREFLDEKIEKISKLYENKEIPLPLNWGGYLVIPELIEFWQGRRSRLHDRILYTKLSGNTWEKARLAP